MKNTFGYAVIFPKYLPSGIIIVITELRLDRYRLQRITPQCHLLSKFDNTECFLKHKVSECKDSVYGGGVGVILLLD